MTQQSNATDLIGRTESLNSLRERLGHCHILQVVGAPGVGKTALLQAYVAATPESHYIDAHALTCNQVIDRIGANRCVVIDHVERAKSPDQLVATLQTASITCVLGGRQVYPGLEVIRLGPLALGAAVELLGSVTPEPSDSAHLEDLARMLDCVPRALLEAAGRLREDSPLRLIGEIEVGTFTASFDRGAWAFSASDYSEPIRGAIAACACFSSGFDASAFAAIAQTDPAILDQLVDASLLESADGVYHMLLPVRELVRAQIPPTQEQLLVVAEHFVERVERDEERGADFEHQGLDAAWKFALVTDLDLAARAAGAIKLTRAQEGRLDELIHILRTTLACRPARVGDILAVELMVRLGELLREQGRHSESISLLERAKALEPSQDSKFYGGIFQNLGISYGYLNQFDRARSNLSKAAQAFASIGLEQQVVRVQSNLSAVYWLEGRLEESAKCLEAVVDSGWDEASLKHNLAVVLGEMGRTDEARVYFEANLAATNPRIVRLSALEELLVLDILDRDQFGARDRLSQLGKLELEMGYSGLNRFATAMNSVLFELRFGQLTDAYSAANRAVKLNDETAGWKATLLHEAISALVGQPTAVLGEGDPSDPDFEARTGHRDLTLAFVEARKKADRAALAELDQKASELLPRCRFLSSRVVLEDLRDRIAATLGGRVKIALGPGAQWIRVGDTEPVHLRRSTTTQALLHALLELHEARPGSTCSVDHLFERAWPNQVWNSSAKARFHTAIHRLRRRVLGDLLVTRDDGYGIKTACVVEHSTTRWSELGPGQQPGEM